MFFLLLLAEINNMHVYAHACTYLHITREYFPQEGYRSAWNPFNCNSWDIGHYDRDYLGQSVNLVRDSLVGI